MHTNCDSENIHPLKFKVGHNAWSNIFLSKNQMWILNQEKKKEKEKKNRPHTTLTHNLSCLQMPFYVLQAISNLPWITRIQFDVGAVGWFFTNSGDTYDIESNMTEHGNLWSASLQSIYGSMNLHIYIHMCFMSKNIDVKWRRGKI